MKDPNERYRLRVALTAREDKKTFKCSGFFRLPTNTDVLLSAYRASADAEPNALRRRQLLFVRFLRIATRVCCHQVPDCSRRLNLEALSVPPRPPRPPPFYIG